MCQHPDCAFLAITGTTEEREKRSKKGLRDSLGPRIPTPTDEPHPDRYKECDHARQRRQRLHLPVQHRTQPTSVIYFVAPAQVEGLEVAEGAQACNSPGCELSTVRDIQLHQLR